MDFRVFIEEPEAHIFPTSQRDIVNLIAFVFNANNGGQQFFITTHSPYILTSFNNLIQAGLLKSSLKNPKQLSKLNKIVDSTISLDRGCVSAYCISGGDVVNIMSTETGLIDGNAIDSASDMINDEFLKLLDFL